MRRVELHQVEDLKLLQNLKGNEYIFLKIYPTFIPTNICAVDLKKFRGTIDIDYENPRFISCTVKVTEGASRQFIFENIENVQILMSKPFFFSIRYKNIPNSFSLRTGTDLEKVSRNVMNQDRIILRFEDDVALQSFPVDFLKHYSGKIQILGENHRLFLKDTEGWNQFLADHSVHCQNLTVAQVDEVISIKEGQELQKLNFLKSGSVVVDICNDLCDFHMESIQLGKFTGNLFLLGHKKKIENVRIRSFHQAHGFISSIHPTSNLEVSSLHFRNITSEHLDKCKEAACILGKRGFVPVEARKHFMPGKILFSGCTIENVWLPQSSNVGTIVGSSDDGMEISNCFDRYVYDSYGNQIRSFLGTSQSYFSFVCSSYDEEDDFQEYCKGFQENEKILKRKRYKL